jgi:hypothetical protein
MKKPLIFFCALIFLGCNGNYDVDFNVHYNPQTKYKCVMQQSSDNKLTYSADDEFLKDLKDNGIKNPTITKRESTIESLVKTGESNKYNYFPLTIEITNISDTTLKKALPVGSLIYGSESNDGPPEIDSISSATLPQVTKNALLKAMKAVFTQTTFPKKKLSIGEDFSNEATVSIPIAGIKFDINMTTNYKLSRIISGTAIFDVLQTSTIKTNLTGHKITLTGDGSGKLIYDMKNNIYKEYEMSSKMKMHLVLDKFTLDDSTATSFKQTTEIISK